MKNESVLDTPRNDLDPTVWKKENGVYNLTEEASCKIMSIASWVMVKTGINNFSLHIAGSITSNQYSDKSDIDLHFCISNLDEITVDELNKEIRKDFDDEIVDDLKYIGTHKVELYFQINPFQDMMSIGCYDFFN